MGGLGKKLKVVLVGFQDQDNLGLRYLMATVADVGHQVEIITYQTDPTPLLSRVQVNSPDIIGFSLIFQYMAPDFAKVIATLRDAGINAHITMGGHYPSFDYAEVLQRIPGLDSIVRFEGEATFVELLRKLSCDKEWRNIEGIAYRSNDGMINATPLRTHIADLDNLPLPDRQTIDYTGEVATASILVVVVVPGIAVFVASARL